MELALVAQAQAAVDDARRRLRGLVRETPLELAPWLGPRVLLKLESEQVTGSFKARGALNKVLALHERGELSRGVVTASTGNHALACAHACGAVQRAHAGLSVDCQIVLPEGASAAKVAQLRALGAPLLMHGADCLAAEEEAMRLARARGACYVSPYNDLEVVGGQGTCGAELVEQLWRQLGASAALDAVLVPVGGGGLIAGVAAAVKRVSPATRVLGCCPANDAHLALSVRAGRLLTPQDGYLREGGATISEGTAGAVEPGSVTFPLAQALVDEWVLLDEHEIGRAVVQLLDKQHKAVEGAAGLGVAAYLKKQQELRGKTVAIVICGGNVNAVMLRALLNQHLSWTTN
jgi:threonine dehydratase